jgi:hypothetical protein
MARGCATEVHKEIARKVFIFINDAVTESGLDTSEQIRVLHSFLPVLDMLIPTDTETEEGQTQTKDESTPPDGPIKRR